MASCAIEGCQDPACPVCRFAGRDPLEIADELRRAWRRERGINITEEPVRRMSGTSGTRKPTRRTKTVR